MQTFREDREHESEFMTISYWEDIPAMARFTGRDPDPTSITSTAIRSF